MATHRVTEFAPSAYDLLHDAVRSKRTVADLTQDHQKQLDQVNALKQRAAELAAAGVPRERMPILHLGMSRSDLADAQAQLNQLGGMGLMASRDPAAIARTYSAAPQTGAVSGAAAGTRAAVPAADLPFRPAPTLYPDRPTPADNAALVATPAAKAARVSDINLGKQFGGFNQGQVVAAETLSDPRTGPVADRPGQFATVGQRTLDTPYGTASVDFTKPADRAPGAVAVNPMAPWSGVAMPPSPVAEVQPSRTALMERPASGWRGTVAPPAPPAPVVASPGTAAAQSIRQGAVNAGLGISGAVGKVVYGAEKAAQNVGDFFNGFSGPVLPQAPVAPAAAPATTAAPIPADKPLGMLPPDNEIIDSYSALDEDQRKKLLMKPAFEGFNSGRA